MNATCDQFWNNIIIIPSTGFAGKNKKAPRTIPDLMLSAQKIRNVIYAATTGGIGRPLAGTKARYINC